QLEVEFEGGSGMSFNEYFQSWSYNRKQWQPIHWERGYRESPQYDVLIFPSFEEDRVFVGTQVPMSFKEAEKLLKEWEEHPDASLNIIAESAQGRPLYRLEINDVHSSVPPADRWVHYFANQHPGEHNSHWRMAAMVDWILSEDGNDYRQRNISHFIFYMSPDASSHAWYRVNEEGVDMNRSYRAEGSHPEEQTHEAYLWQKDLEDLMESNTPVSTIWAMHTWQGIVEPIIQIGPEMDSIIGPWSNFRDIIRENDPDTLIKPLSVLENAPSYSFQSWTGGPHEQFGITTILCEGAGAFYTKKENRLSGEILIKSIAEYYEGTKD
ncbi:MAG TPA: M14 family zinc carboxypeptidase, partial [Fodinibius sp.]|nr:M14 family zinc carboxypeptidase [Fodinibius sp.]